MATPLDRNFLLNALLRRNYLPNQTKMEEEIPPVFSSESFSNEAAEKLQKAAQRKGVYKGYDSVEYKLTRFSGAPRILSIPHPKAYANLSLIIAANWDEFRYITNGENSMLRIDEHEDGRVIIMGYSGLIDQEQLMAEKSLGKHFLARADIANFYPSIYSHSIPWALVGFDVAKSNRDRKEWYNKIDIAAQLTRRNETNGVATGPATSTILSEAILARIDEVLNKNFEFTRITDDYTAYCTTKEEASEFILSLTKELAKYNLRLGPAKTSISDLPQPISVPWVFELSVALPRYKEISPTSASRYLDFAVDLARRFPSGSVLKYALKSLLGCDLTKESRITVLRYGTTLAVHQPVLLPVLSKIIETTSSSEFNYQEVLPFVLREHVKFGRSDAIAWTLHYCRIHGVDVSKKIVNDIIQSGDCIPILLLSLMEKTEYVEPVVEFANSLDPQDIYGLDRYWILLYQLFRDGLISQPYPDDRTFKILRDAGVSFVDPTVGRG